MRVIGEAGDGSIDVDNGRRYFKKAPSHTPYCHFCRKRVDIVVELVPGNPGNPRHACKPCLENMLEGFKAAENV